MTARKKKASPAATRVATRPAWTKFERAQAVNVFGEKGVIWENSLYTVIVFQNGPIIHLSIRDAERTARHDWRDLQRIKNELVGPEHEAVEVYPAESRLMDSANSFHLWVFADPTYRLPFGFQQRLVADHAGSGNAKQRPFRPGERPPDALTREQMDEMAAGVVRRVQ